MQLQLTCVCFMQLHTKHFTSPIPVATTGFADCPQPSDLKFYHLRMQRSNIFGRVCLFVCPVGALTFERLDLQIPFLVRSGKGHVSWSRVKVAVIRAYMYTHAGGLLWLKNSLVVLMICFVLEKSNCCQPERRRRWL